MFGLFKNKTDSDAGNNNPAANELESAKIGGEIKNAADIELLKEKAGVLHFVYEGRVFKPVKPRCDIPGVGKRTAVEVCTDPAAQKYLVENKCSAIAEIL